MARKLRVQYPGAVYHVMSRGNRRGRIFVDDEDRRKFLQTLSEACQKTGWEVHAYCLMNNHLHAVVETPDPNLGRKDRAASWRTRAAGERGTASREPIEEGTETA